MRQFTTPTLTINLLKPDKTPAVDVPFDYLIFTLKSNDYQIDRKVLYSELDENASFEVAFTQEETASFKLGDFVYAEINWFKDDKRYATAIKNLKVAKNLLDEVILE